MADRHPVTGSLIFNEPMKLSFALSGAEVDLLAINLYDKKREIDEETANAYLQGIFEGTLMKNVTLEHKRNKMIAILEKGGKSESQIDSYLRGWDQVGTHLDEDQ